MPNPAQCRRLLAAAFVAVSCFACQVASAQDVRAVEDRKDAALQSGHDVQTDQKTYQQDHDQAAADAAALDHARATGNAAQAAQDRANLNAARQGETNEHTLADDHRDKAAADDKNERAQAHHMAHEDTHDIRVDKKLGAEHAKDAARDDAAMKQAQAQGNHAQAARDRMAMNTQHADANHDHVAANTHRETRAKDQQVEQPK